MQKDDNIPVSDTDELTTEGGPYTDRARKLGEYWPSNSPLSADEIKRRQSHEWPPQTTEDIEDMRPLPENEPEDEWPDGA